ncbi:MAG: class I SAM-dependent methyltransferase [Planctomycetota bacterium]
MGCGTAPDTSSVDRRPEGTPAAAREAGKGEGQGQVPTGARPEDAGGPAVDFAKEARAVIEKAGVRGGLVVHLGCGGGELTMALRASDSYVVHGLDVDRDRVTTARKRIRDAGLYGPVAVDVLGSKHLPYAENLVNLLVAEDLGPVTMEEVTRVLAPRGVACVRKGGKWTKTVKPVPPDTDEWLHYLHGADNNAVARDTVVGPPRRTQWVAGPMYARSHEINSSAAAIVSAGGRLFYIWDENPIGLTDKRFPPKWSLIARDAMNGVVLWKRPVPDWGWRKWHPESRWDDPRERAKMLRHLPSTLPRRLVAAGGLLYVTLGYEAPVSVLDATTGEVLREFEGTDLTDEILHDDGALVLRVRLPDSPRTGTSGEACRRGRAAA